MIRGEIKLVYKEHVINRAVYNSKPQREQIVESWRWLYNDLMQNFYIHIYPYMFAANENQYSRQLK